MVKFNNSLKICFLSTTVKSDTSKVVKTLPISYTKIYSILTGARDTKLVWDSSGTAHNTSWAVAGVLYAYTTSNITIGRIRSTTVSWHLVFGI